MGEGRWHDFAHRVSEVAYGGGGGMMFLDLWMGLRLWELVGAERGRRRGRQCTRQQPQRPRSLR